MPGFVRMKDSAHSLSSVPNKNAVSVTKQKSETGHGGNKKNILQQSFMEQEKIIETLLHILLTDLSPVVGDAGTQSKLHNTNQRRKNFTLVL